MLSHTFTAVAAVVMVGGAITDNVTELLAVQPLDAVAVAVYIWVDVGAAYTLAVFCDV